MFPHSHFCEKARWALDYKGVPYRVVALLPLLHGFTVRRHAPKTTVPVLLTNGQVIQGSSEIIDHVDELVAVRRLTPTDGAELEEGRRLEAWASVHLGDHLRRLLYDRLLAWPEFICRCFGHGMSASKRTLLRAYYPLLRLGVYRVFVGGPEKVERSRHEFASAMDHLAKVLDGRSYLVGDSFSRVDLSVASLLSLLAVPPEHPLPFGEIPDEGARAFMDGYRDHPVTRWTLDMYAKHRR